MIKKYLEKKISLKERKRIYKKEVTDKMMNPCKDMVDFDPMKDDTEEYQLAKRSRVDVPKELPTMELKPKKLLEGQMIGMYESKQDLYLIFAHKCNMLQEKVDKLEARITELENK